MADLQTKLDEYVTAHGCTPNPTQLSRFAGVKYSEASKFLRNASTSQSQPSLNRSKTSSSTKPTKTTKTRPTSSSVSKGPSGKTNPLRPQNDTKTGTKHKPTDSVVQRMQQLILDKDMKIKTLTQKINELAVQQMTLQRKAETLSKSRGVPGGPSQASAANALAAKFGAKKPSGGGVDSGPSSKGAAAALAAKLGGHVKNKKMAENKAGAGGGGGVEARMSQRGAKNALVWMHICALIGC